jgi:hypothetical protein
VPGATPLKADSGLQRSVSYDDKITVSIVKVEGAEVQGQGPGIISGQHIAVFTLKFTNGSTKPLDLNRVRLNLRYGDNQTSAEPSYYGNLNDFFGAISPGQSKLAGYGFILPDRRITDVRIQVKFNSKHSAAVFVGAIG